MRKREILIVRYRRTSVIETSSSISFDNLETKTVNANPQRQYKPIKQLTGNGRRSWVALIKKLFRR